MYKRKRLDYGQSLFHFVRRARRVNKLRGKNGRVKSWWRETRFTLPDFFLFAVFSRVTWERGTTRSAKEVRNVYRDSFIQTKNTPDSGNLQKVLMTVSTRKVIIQDMISKVFDQPAVGFSLVNSLYVNKIYHISR